MVLIPGVFEAHSSASQALAAKLGVLLQLPVETAEQGHTGSGDGLMAWLATLTSVLLALLGASLWSLLQRKPVRHEKLLDFFQVYLRVFLLQAMLSYGIVKLLCLQFPTPGEDRLLSTYGDSSPMGLMWTFMGFSPAYQIFAGALETVSGELLIFRRTATLGALLVCAVMGHVFLLNLCFDVPVKLMSLELLLTGVFLASLDAGRLVSALVLNRSVPPADHSFQWWAQGRWRRARYTASVLAFGSVLVLNLLPFAEGLPPGHDEVDPRSATGVYEVTASEGVVGLERLTVGSHAARLSYQGDVMHRVALAENLDEHRVLLKPIGSEPGATANLVREGEAPVFTFTGEWEGKPVIIATRKLSAAGSRLMTRGFHWVTEYPFNR